MIAVYVLCAVTSFACAVLLGRSWLKTHSRLLLWCAVGFVGLTVNNILLVADLVIFPDPSIVDLRIWRTAAGLAGLLVLLYGLIRETTGVKA